MRDKVNWPHTLTAYPEYEIIAHGIIPGGVLFALTGHRAKPTSDILVRAWAGGEYSRIVNGDSSVQPETCVFFQGHCFLGDASENAAEVMPFDRFVPILGKELLLQTYPPSADLLFGGVSFAFHGLGPFSVTRLTLQVAQFSQPRPM